MFHVPEHFRRFPDGMPRIVGDNFGAFLIPPSAALRRRPLFCVASAGEHEHWPFHGPPWHHVSVSIPGASVCPSWDDMCHVKSLFWDPEDCVVQFHPPASEYVNEHAYCLHLWSVVGIDLPRPPSLAVGTR